MSIFEEIIGMFSYSFMIRAMIVGGLVALIASILGVVLVLKRYSMIGDGLSHVGFGAMAISLAFNEAPLVFAIPIVIVAAFLLLRVSENSKIKGDAAIGLISSSSLAIGMIINSLSNGTNIDLNSYMFGSILAIEKSEMILCIILGVIIIGVFIYFYNPIFAVTFDENFAKATGLKVEVYKTVLSVLTALTIVIGMRIMGTLLISSLIIFPALSAMRITKKFKSVMIISVIISLVCFFAGLIASYLIEIPTGASIVVSNLIMFIVMSIIGLFRGKM
ncbi:MAG: metal ABC transporter permease [Lachnospiraceae bacterium]|nr:metal ABC transporter permease [Lachnospiraceae bacterium]